MAIEGVLYVPDSKFNLISVDSITKSTHFEVLFGKNNCLLTDPDNPGFSQVLGYNHGGLYHLAGKVLYGIRVKQQTQLRGHFRHWLLLLLLLLYINKLDNSNLVLILKM